MNRFEFVNMDNNETYYLDFEQEEEKLGGSMVAYVCSLESGYSIEQVSDSGLFHESPAMYCWDACAGFYDYDINHISTEDAKEILEGMGWSFKDLKPFVK